MSANQGTLKLVVDKRTNHVLFAESNKDFVDIILSFLTMPLGTLLRLLGKQTAIGSMTTLYESVEVLDVQFLKTKACKNMLLHPQNAYDEKLKELLVTVEDTEISYYLCGTSEKHGFSTVMNTLCCKCGKEMNQKITKTKKNIARDVDEGVFTKGLLSYLITDDLLVLPASIVASLDVLTRHGISDKTWLEERNVKVGRKEVLRLFKRLLLSKTLLTDAFLRTDDTVNALDLNPRDLSHCMSEIYTGEDPKEISIKLVLNKSTGKVSFAEALSLLKASLISKTVLSDALYPNQPKQGRVKREVTERKRGNTEKGGAKLVCPICLCNPKDMAFGCGHQGDSCF